MYARLEKKESIVNDISSITARIIKERSASPKFKNMMNLIDKHFDVWTKELFPILQSEDIPCYPEIVKIMDEAGYKVSAPQLRSYFSAIRKRRGILAKSYKGQQTVTPSVTLTPMAREIQSAPVSRFVPSARAVAPVAQAVPVLAVPGEEAVEVSDWHAQSRRLSSEGRNALWTSEDEWMWEFIETKAKNRNLNIFKNAPDVEEMLDVHQIDCYASLMSKKRRK